MTNWDNGYDCGFSYGHRKAIEECGNLMREQEDRIAELSRRLNDMTLKYLHAKCGDEPYDDEPEPDKYVFNSSQVEKPFEFREPQSLRMADILCKTNRTKEV